ncbi:hypothetical protein EJ08DRAFT_560907, partial [Tothia fuscella]
GSGCRANSVSTNFNGDRTILTLIFNDFIANFGPGIPAQQNRRFCKVDLKMKVPKGWTFQVNTVDWRGYIDLDRGVRGSLASSYFWSASRGDQVINLYHQTNIHKQIEGPVHDSYLKHKDGEKDKAVWLPCTTTESVLNINTAVRLSRSNGNNNNGPGVQSNNAAKGSITVDSIDAKFKQVLNLGWKKC